MTKTLVSALALATALFVGQPAHAGCLAAGYCASPPPPYTIEHPHVDNWTIDDLTPAVIAVYQGIRQGVCRRAPTFQGTIRCFDEADAAYDHIKDFFFGRAWSACMQSGVVAFDAAQTPENIKFCDDFAKQELRSFISKWSPR